MNWNDSRLMQNQGKHLQQRCYETTLNDYHELRLTAVSTGGVFSGEASPEKPPSRVVFPPSAEARGLPHSHLFLCF